MINAVAKNPLANSKELMKATWLSMWAVHKHKKQLENSWEVGVFKTQAIEQIINKDLDIVHLAQDIIINKFKDKENIKGMKATEVSSVARDSAARYTLLKGNVTDEMWGLKELNLDWKTLLELEKIRRDLLLD